MNPATNNAGDQIVQINLLINAMDATPEGGKIVISTGIRDKGPDNWVEISVRDNGTGIQSEHLDRIFDPYFTTKGVGEGTGLGLAICYKIVQSHGGFLEVVSKPGQGTEFHVLLPMRQETPAILDTE